jgi:hypothetical protein
MMEVGFVRAPAPEIPAPESLKKKETAQFVTAAAIAFAIAFGGWFGYSSWRVGQAESAIALAAGHCTTPLFWADYRAAEESIARVPQHAPGSVDTYVLETKLQNELTMRGCRVP